jgi:endonuclease/exonuclease/phosphatase family metal-dependent hydrolase
MDVTVGTFNVNNLFGRWNLYVDVSERPEVTDAAAEGRTAREAPRRWLRPAAPAEPIEPEAAGGAETRTSRESTGGRRSTQPDVQITISGTRLPSGAIRWRTNPLTGSVVYEKPEAARQVLADRITQMDVDVLAVQEVEDIKTLEAFVRSDALKDLGYRHVVLVEGNDERLIDVGLLSRFPLGAVTSWRHRTYRNGRGGPIFSRDLLQVDVQSKDRSTTLFTVFVNHLKSQLARDANERRRGNERRRRQAETIQAIVGARPAGPVIILGDMNDTPDSSRLAGIRQLGVVNALAQPDEVGGPYPADDPDGPTTRAWTHRYKSGGPAQYELFDQIWLSPDLAARQTSATILRRTTLRGDATDHDPAWVGIRL